MKQKNHNQDIQELELSLCQMESDLKEHYQELGKTVLEIADQQQKEVNRLVDNIILTRKQLSIARQEIECENCLAFNPMDARYCKRCGKKLIPIKEKENNNG